MIIVGIDPGITGAAACLFDGKLVWVKDLPIEDRRLDGGEFARMVGRPDVVYLERVHAMPKNGSISAFSLGQTYGSLLAVMSLLKIPVHLVAPSTWKAKMGVGASKDAARVLARTLFPNQSDYFKLAKDHNRADATLIARYGSYDQVAMANA